MLALPQTAFSQSMMGTGNDVKVLDFHTQGLDDTGKAAWSLNGGEAEVRGNVTEMNNIRANFIMEGGKNIIINSPSCRFMHNLRELKSDAPLTLTAEGITATGIGYDVYLDSRLLRIRSTVKIIVKRNKLNLDETINPHTKKDSTTEEYEK